MTIVFYEGIPYDKTFQQILTMSLLLGTGACILYGISRVVIGENETFLGGEAYLKQRGIEVVNMQSKECKDLMEIFIKEKPELWYVGSPGHAGRIQALK